MHTVEYKYAKYFVNGYVFCRDLFELFTPSNMHILTETGSYTGDIKAVPGRSMYVHHEDGGVWLCQTKMIEGFPIKNKSHILINHKGDRRWYNDEHTKVWIFEELINIKHNRVRFVLENKKCIQ